MKRFRWRSGSAGARGVVAIVAGTAFGQIVGLMAAPALSRLYSPQDFGTFSIVSALAITFGTVTALRYEAAIPLPEDDSDARNLVALGALMCFFTGAVLCIIVAVWHDPLAQVFDDDRLTKWLIAAPPIAALFGLYRLLNQWALRQSKFGATARRNVLQSVTTVVVQLIAGWRGSGGGGLITGFGVGQGLGAISMLFGSGLTRGRVTTTLLIKNLKRYRRFPLFLAPAGLMNAGGIYLPLLLVAALYGTTAAGFLGFSQRIVALPITLIGQSVAQVYLSELAQSRRNLTGREHRLFWAATKRLAVLSLVGIVILTAAGPFLFITVFGDQWRVSGIMAQALALSVGAQLVAGTLSQTLIVYERTGLQLAWDAARLVSTSAAVLITHHLGGGTIACIWVLSISSTATYGLSWELSRRTVVKPGISDATIR